MKKVNNILLLCALGLIVLGNLLFWGARGYKYLKREELDKNIGNKQFEIYGDIDSVDITAQFADIEIKTADSYSCYVENVDLSKTDAYASNGTMYIKAGNTENMEVLGWNIGNVIDCGKRAKIILYIPEKDLNNFRIDLGTGTVTAGKISTSRFVLQLGAGNISIDSLKVAGSGAIQTGGVNTKIYSFDAGTFTVKNGAGDVDIRLAGNAGEYDIKASDTIGRIDIFNSYKYGIKADLLRRGDGLKKLVIDNGAGRIAVK